MYFTLSHQSCPTQQQADGLIDLVERCICHGMPGNENDIPALTNLGLLDSQPHGFAHPALDPVPVYRFSNPPPNDKSKTTVIQVIGQRCHYQQRLDKGSSLTPDALKVGVLSQAVLSAHLACRRP
jgi:hypothetical protein